MQYKYSLAVPWKVGGKVCKNWGPQRIVHTENTQVRVRWNLKRSHRTMRKRTCVHFWKLSHPYTRNKEYNFCPYIRLSSIKHHCVQAKSAHVNTYTLRLRYKVGWLQSPLKTKAGIAFSRFSICVTAFVKSIHSTQKTANLISEAKSVTHMTRFAQPDTQILIRWTSQVEHTEKKKCW